MKKINSILTILSLIGFIAISVLIHSFNSAYEINKKYVNLTKDISSIKYQNTISHLWLEEFLSHDVSIFKQHIFSPIRESRRDLAEISKKIQNQIILTEIAKLDKIIQKFEENGLKRYSNPTNTEAGSDIDQAYDKIFAKLINSANKIQKYIQDSNQQELQEYLNFEKVLILIILIFIILSFIFIKNSEKKRMEFLQKLNSSFELFGKHVIISKTDEKGIITYASEALCEISGYTKEELIGEPHVILRDSSMSSDIFKDMWQTIESGNTWNGELKNRKKDGDTYWVQTSIIPDFNKDKKIVGYTSVRHDITAQKAKDDFMSNMSHELRTPLNSIIGFSGILNKKIENKEYKELALQINSSSKSLLHLINDILDLSKIQNSKFNIDPFEFNAYREIDDFTYLFEGLTAKKTLNFETTLSDSLNSIFLGDWTRINQIILNLISNSVKFTPKDGLIKFDANYINDNLIISISDNGIGMNKEAQDKIFKPFEQADGSTTRKYGGTGLGLSITQSLVEIMNGKIELESQEGVGTTFKVTLPLERLSDAKDEIVIEHEVKKEGLNIHLLVAEDNKTNQILIKMLLEEFAITCDMANDGIEALEMYDPDKHALILMDENMPNMNCIESMKKIKQKFGEKCTPIVALTANAMAGDKERFLNLGMDDYVSKPIDEDELYRVIKGLT